MHPAQYPDHDEAQEEEHDERRDVDHHESQVDVKLYNKYLPVEDGKIQVYYGVQDQ